MKANEPLIWSYLWPGSLLYLFLFVFSHYMTITEMFHSAGALLPDNLKVFRRPSCRFTSFLTLVIFLQCSQDWWAHYLWLSLFVFFNALVVNISGLLSNTISIQKEV